MIRYLFDTDTLSYLTRRRFPQLQQRYMSTPDSAYAISVITYAEVLFGVEALVPHDPVRLRVLSFLDTVQVLPWPVEAAAFYAQIRHDTRKQPLADRDMMIGAHALALGAAVVTNNTRHFHRMGSALRVENWLW